MALGRSTLAAVAVAAAAGLPACGQNLPADEFAARANDVCSESAQRAAALPAPSQAGAGELARLAERAKGIASDAERRLAKIVPPRDTASEYGELLIHVGDLVEQFEELGDAAAADDAGRVTEIVDRLRRTAAKGARAARESGLGACARALDLDGARG